MDVIGTELSAQLRGGLDACQRLACNRRPDFAHGAEHRPIAQTHLVCQGVMLLEADRERLGTRLQGQPRRRLRRRQRARQAPHRVERPLAVAESRAAAYGEAVIVREREAHDPRLVMHQHERRSNLQLLHDPAVGRRAGRSRRQRHLDERRGRKHHRAADHVVGQIRKPHGVDLIFPGVLNMGHTETQQGMFAAWLQERGQLVGRWIPVVLTLPGVGGQ